MIKIPSYEYECPNCGVIEHYKSMNDPDIEECPKCNSKVKRLYSTGGVSWNCSGSYSKIGS